MKDDALLTSRHSAQQPLHPVDDQDAFLQETIDLFSGHQKGHLIHQCYLSPRALEFWSEFMKHSGYYVTRSELGLIPSVAAVVNGLAAHPDGVVGIENGPGTESALQAKTIPMFSQIDGLHTYVGRDWSNAVVDNIARVLPDHLQGVRIIPDLADFNHHALPEGLPKGRKVITEMGVTIGNKIGDPSTNFLERELKAGFAFQRTLLDKGDIYIPSIDVCQDWDAVKYAYTSKWLTQWGRQLFRHMKATMPFQGNFDPEGFVFESIPHPHTHVGANTMVATCDMEFSISGNFFKATTGQGYVITNSGKPPIEMVRDIASDTRFEVPKIVQDDLGRITFPALRAA